MAKSLFKHTVLHKDRLPAPFPAPFSMNANRFKSPAQLSPSIMCTQFIYISLVTGDKQHSPEVTLDKSWLHPVTGHQLLVPQSLSQRRDHDSALPIPTVPGWDNPSQFWRMQHSAEVWKWMLQVRDMCDAKILCRGEPLQLPSAPGLRSLRKTWELSFLALVTPSCLYCGFPAPG